MTSDHTSGNETSGGGSDQSTVPAPATPARRFLVRGQQLQRLQERVIAHMMTEIEREHEAWKALPATNSSEIVKAAGAAAQIAAASMERVADVQLMLQLYFCRHVDNFQTFLDETLRAIYTTQHALLKRSDPVAVAQVLQHAEMRFFVEWLIDTRLHKLAYKSLEEFATILKEEIKFELFADHVVLKAIATAYDVRNLVTHNYGIVNRIFLSKHPDAGLVVDQPYPVSPDAIASTLKTMIAAATDIERRAVAKFKVFLESS